MNRIEEQPQEYDLCGQVIGAAMKVHSVLGPGFLESVYQNALIWELRKVGLKAEAERPISVHYDGQLIGAFTADLLVNDLLIGVDEGLLLNFGAERLEFKKKFRVPKSEPVSL